MRSLIFRWTGVGLLLAGCGPKMDATGGASETEATATVSEATGPTDGTATGSPTTGTATGSPTTGTATGSPTTGTATEPTTGAAACDSYMSSADFGPRLQLTVQYNEGADPLWIEAETCGGIPRIVLVDELGEPLLETTLNGGSKLCDDFLGSVSECEIGGEDCGVPRLLRLEPGVSITINRPAVQFMEMQMTAECAPGTNCQGSCLRADPLAAGKYSVGVSTFRTCVGDCECDAPPVDGWCRVFGAAEPGEVWGAFAAELVYPGAMEATVVIQGP